MDIITYHNILQPLFTAINYSAPNQEAQRNFIDLVRNMEKTAEPYENIIKALVNKYADGLNYGNW